VIMKECGQYVVHGLHGNGQPQNGTMYELLQLVQTQKKWIQSEIFRWTGRKVMRDACAATGKRSFMPGRKFDTPQNNCKKKIYDRHPAEFPVCKLINQKGAVSLPYN